MLGKLMKHEFRATGRILLPIYLLLMVTTVFFNIMLRLTAQPAPMPNGVATIIAVLDGVAKASFVIALIGTAVMTFALMIWRFYKNLMTDEGYLMFTLPANTDSILWSKLLTAVIWSFITLAVFAAVVAMSFVIQDANGVREFFRDLIPFWNSLDITAGQVISYGAEILAFAVSAVLASFLMFYAAISLGHSFSNHKILLSVVFYIVFSIALQIVMSMAVAFGIFTFIPSDLFADGDNLALSMQLVMLFGIGINLVECIGFYVLTHCMLKRHLNLQ